MKELVRSWPPCCISPVAVSNSNITIFLNPTTGVSQPLPFLKEQPKSYRNAELIEEVKAKPIDELDPPGASTVNELHLL